MLCICGLYTFLLYYARAIKNVNMLCSCLYYFIRQSFELLLSIVVGVESNLVSTDI